MFPALVDRNGGRAKLRIREGADRYRNQTLRSFQGVVDLGTTAGAEAKRDLRSFISDSNVFNTSAADFESRAGKTSLLAEHAARSPLTGQAVAYGYAKRFPLHFNLKLTAAALRSAPSHPGHGRLRRNRCVARSPAMVSAHS